MHRLLARQLRKNLGLNDLEELEALLAKVSDSPHCQDIRHEISGLPELLKKVSASYDQFSRDLALRSRSLDLSSEELHSANSKLRQQTESQAQIIASLRDTANQMLINEGKPKLSPELKELDCLSQIMADLVRERAQSQVELKNQKFALDQHAIVSVTDVDGSIVYANQKFCDITGYSEAELLGQNHRILRTKHTAPEVFVDMWKAITNGEVWHGEFCNRKKNGGTFWVSATIVPLFNGTKEPSGYIAIRTDLTERKHIEDHLRRAICQAEAANKTKSEFLATMSHEIRTPMNGVIGMAELLSETALSNEQQRYVKNIYTSGDALLNIINDILDFSKLDAKKLELELREFNVEELTDEVTELLSSKAYDKGLGLYHYIPEAINKQPYYVGDAGRIRQVITNLLGNAIKFTKQGSVYVQVSETKRGSIRYEISDTGIGIPEEAKNKLFASFSQVDASTSRRFGGTGLGLAISKQLVELMEGQIGVDSVVDKGSTFWFELPLERIETKTKQVELNDDLDLGGLSVLVVDDTPLNCEIFERSLMDWGIQVRTVNSVQDAIREIEQWQPELVLIDLMMPITSGSIFVDQVRSDPRFNSTKLIMVSSTREHEARRIMDLNQLDAYMVKPIKRTDLLEQIHSVFGAKTPIKEVVKKAIETANRQKQDSGLKILLAEDNEVNQEVAIGLLHRLGHEVVLAENGFVAIDNVKEQDFDLVFMDIQMPECDGNNAIKAIRELGGDKAAVPIVAMTANAMRGDREKCLQVGADGYIAKPINKEKLFLSLDEFCKKGRVASQSDSKADDVFLLGRKDDYNAAEISSEDLALDQQPIWNEEALSAVTVDLGIMTCTRVIHTFIANAEQKIALIEQEFIQGNTEAVRKYNHSLKGASLAVGANRIAILAFYLEHHECNEALIEELKELYQEFKRSAADRFPEKRVPA